MPQDGGMETLPLKEEQWNIKKQFITKPAQNTSRHTAPASIYLFN